MRVFSINSSTATQYQPISGGSSETAGSAVPTQLNTTNEKSKFTKLCYVDNNLLLFEIGCVKIHELISNGNKRMQKYELHASILRFIRNISFQSFLFSFCLKWNIWELWELQETLISVLQRSQHNRRLEKIIAWNDRIWFEKTLPVFTMLEFRY